MGADADEGTYDCADDRGGIDCREDKDTEGGTLVLDIGNVAVLFCIGVMIGDGVTEGVVGREVSPGAGMIPTGLRRAAPTT